MRNYFTGRSAAALALVVGLFAVTVAYAATPTFSVTNVSGDSVQINVNGDPNSGVAFFYNVGSSGGTFQVSLGSTDASGAFSTTLSPNSYGLIPGSSMYVVVNSQQSATQSWSTNATSTASGSGQAITFGLNNPSLTIGQSINISLAGGSGYYISSNSNPGVAQAGVSGNALSLSGVTLGSDLVTVCAAAGGCGTVSITVAGVTATQTQNQTQTTVQGGGNYASFIATIQSMQAQLSQILLQIQAMANTLTQLVAGLSTGATAQGTAASTANSYVFTQFLSLGSQGAEVTALQQYLAGKGFYSSSVTGYFGPETEAAVKAYQSAHGITPLGYVGPSTRADLNSGK